MRICLLLSGFPSPNLPFLIKLSQAFSLVFVNLYPVLSQIFLPGGILAPFLGCKPPFAPAARAKALFGSNPWQ